MQRNHLPETLTVRTGRDGETGFHLFYSGARPTTNFDLDGVVGQIKSEGGYVIGPGSIHPSGKVYQIINDVPLASFPVGVFPAQAKSKSIMVTANPVIPEGNRWPNLQSKAGTFRNAGLSRETERAIRTTRFSSWQIGPRVTSATKRPLQVQSDWVTPISSQRILRIPN